MATFDQIGLAYCIENTQQAESIAQELGSAVRFRHFVGGGEGGKAPLSEQLHHFDGPVVLLISDNFLRSIGCMHRGLALFQEHQHRLLPVVIDGMQEDGPVHTSFERVTDIIQYINYWQDQYLDLRRQKRELSGLDESTFNEHIKLVRDVSSEAGEFLRQVRSLYHLQYPEFVVDDYHQLFIFVEDEPAWKSFQVRRQQALAAAPPPPPPTPPAPQPEPQPAVAVADIPGINEVLSEPEKQELSDAIQHDEPVVPVEATPAQDIEWEIEPTAGQVPEHAPVVEDEEEADEEPAYEPQPVTAQTAADEQLAELVRKAWSMADSGQEETGITLLEAALENYPSDNNLRYHYALMLAHKREDIVGARAQLETLLQSAPKHEDALFLLAELADLSGDAGQARHLFEQVLSLNEDYPDAWSRLGTILSQHFPSEKEEAAHALKRAAKLDPENADAAYTYAQVLMAMPGKEKKARKYLERTLELAPAHPQAGLDIAILLHQEGSFKKAHAAYMAAVAINADLRTAAHDAMFALAEEVAAPVAAMAPAASSGFEHGALTALKDNIAQLEALLKAREEAEARAQAEAAAKEAAVPPPAPKPGAGKTVFISGATSGIGKATAEKFASEGYRLIVTGRRQERLLELQQAWQEQWQAEVLILNFDIRDQQAVQQAVDQLPEAWQQIDVLVNNAGKAKGLDLIHEGELAHWEEMIDTNIKGLLYLTRAISPLMVARGQGHIINVCSTAGKEVYQRGNVYSATKFAVEALTKSMRLDLHDKGVRVGQVSPAHVEETEFALVRFDGDSERAEKVYDNFKPLSASDVAEAIYFIASQPAYVNILDVTMQSIQQASSNHIDRSGRAKYE